MFKPIYDLRLYEFNEQKEVRDRWVSFENHALFIHVLNLIKNGAGEDFLVNDVQNGILKGFLRDEYDLRGLSISSEDISFPDGDNFQGIDFSYCQFGNCIFKNCYFRACFDFGRLLKSTFINCIFHCTSFLGTTIVECKFIDCIFIEGVRFTNCSFENTKYLHYFIDDNIFFDCKFDDRMVIEEPSTKPIIELGGNLLFSKNQFSSFFMEVANAYSAGGFNSKKNRYYFKSRYFSTRYNSNSTLEAIGKLIIELLCGYGIRPFRSIFAGILIVLGFSLFYNTFIGNFFESFLVSTSAFLSMGDFSRFPQIYKIGFLFEGFLGLFILGIYLTTLFNKWFTEK